MPDDLEFLAGDPPLTPRVEPWLRRLLADPDACAALVAEFGSPVNVLHPEPLLRNAAELVDAARAAGVRAEVYFARKANKAVSLATTAASGGHGVDVASERELRQCLEAGVPGERTMVTAAVKTDALLALALDAGATVSLDHLAELDRVRSLAAGRRPRVALRLALPPDAGLPPTRFGELAEVWLATDLGGVEVAGVHFHLHGYAAADRLVGLDAALALVDALAERGHRPAFVDIGGGVPMSYLDDRAQWERFWAVMDAGSDEASLPTWKGHRLGRVYPSWQSPVRGAWLAGLLGERLGARPGEPGVPGAPTASEALASRGLALRLEPGRSLVDGCGATLARVAFRKQRSDGVGLIGLEMNRTQCRTTADDFLADPVLVRAPGRPHRAHAAHPDAPASDFLVGAYCIEDELILLRRLAAASVEVGDLVAFVNTGGYFMHILESASHQLPLARNVVWRDGSGELDPIDR